MSATNAFLLLGTNLGDRIENLRTGRERIAKQIGSTIRSSSIYETASWGKEDQPAFLNQAIEIKTELEPLKLLHALKEIEKDMGRTQTVRWDSRLIDIDILLMDSIVFDSPSLSIPHPRMQQRRFTLTPLAEIAPHVMHPVLHLPISELLKRCDDKLEVRLYTEIQNKLSA